jgi:hypothetical protein
MTVQAENDQGIHLWIDRQHAHEAKPSLEPNDADKVSVALAHLALGAIVVAVLFALSLAVWAGGPLALKGLLHDVADVAGWVTSFFG